MSIASKSDLNSLSDADVANLDDDAIEEVNNRTIQVTSYTSYHTNLINMITFYILIGSSNDKLGSRGPITKPFKVCFI